MTAVFEKTSTGVSAYVEEVPGVGVAGATIEEAEKLLREALVLHFEADPSAIPMTYKTRTLDGLVTITSALAPLSVG